MRKWWVLVVIFVSACSRDNSPAPTLFKNVTTESGVNFVNELNITEQLNPYTYRNFYNGAGVALGDINNDGLLDLYFAGNQVDNKLYLNLGNFRFRDITDSAGVACRGVWSTGVTFADVNADGFLDLYVCKSGNPDAPHRYNELFINNGDLTFTEKSKDFGLDITGLSVQAAFFDYDKDGDLDCYLLTNSMKSIGSFDLVKDHRKVPDPEGGGNKFFLNENGKFRDYSAEAGIFRSNIGFGLGITLGDFNEDTWTDIFVSNDFFERDYLYINDRKGGFTEELPEYFQSISMGSMGADYTDLDNDGDPELFVTEMLPDSLQRKKTKTVFENWNKHQLNVENGYYDQFSRNVLQKKVGNGDYAEVGRLAGIAATEWSWGALLFDMDNDGLRDIFVANGIYKDLLDRDYLTFSGSEENIRKIIREEGDKAIVKLIELMPSSSFPNYAFRNLGGLKFQNAAHEWGLDAPMISSGSAYGDLDNDGDLDLVVSNINAPSVLYQNTTDTSVYKSFRLTLTSRGKNTMQVGAHMTAYAGGQVYSADNFVTRGYQSSVQPGMLVGIGQQVKTIDSLVIQWPAGGYTLLYDVPVNRELRIERESAALQNTWTGRGAAGENVKLSLVSKAIFRHRGSGLVDFNRERLLPMMYSNEMPALLKGDINQDGKEEVYVGGGKDQESVFIKVGQRPQKFVSPAIAKLSLCEETRGALFDADRDGDLDFYMATGGRFYPNSSSAMLDHLFLNDGTGHFTEAAGALPATGSFSTSVAKPFDFDHDGDWDLILGERFEPFVYGLGGRAYLLENDGKGNFKDVTEAKAPALKNMGMVTDAEVADLDGDGWQDVILVGDWMPVVAMKNTGGQLTLWPSDLGLEGTEGWWHDIETGDFNRDGVTDFVVGNHGLNTFFKAGDRMHINDFDQNGSVEQLYCTKIGDRYYPVLDKDDLLSQLPSLKKSLLFYKDYGNKSIDELFSKEVMARSKVLEVKVLASTLFLSGPRGYTSIPLPLEAQFSPVYSLLIMDFDKDGTDDLVAGGNQYEVKPQFGRFDASFGWLFRGRNDGGRFSFKRGEDLGVKGQIRDIEFIENAGDRYLIFAKYEDDVEIYKIPD